MNAQLHTVIGRGPGHREEWLGRGMYCIKSWERRGYNRSKKKGRAFALGTLFKFVVVLINLPPIVA